MSHPQFLGLGLFSKFLSKKRSKNIFRPLFWCFYVRYDLAWDAM